MHEFHLYVEKNCIYYKNQKKKIPTKIHQNVFQFKTKKI